MRMPARAAGEITITETDEIYICAVLGPRRSDEPRRGPDDVA
jgi:hypothetical protein